MCIFQHLHFHCGHTALQISRPCPHATTNAQNELFCPADPHPHLNDSPEQVAARIFDPKTYTPGVCAFIHCRWKYGVQAEGDFEGVDDEVYDQPRNEFDLSDDACRARERAWFRLLSPGQIEACDDVVWPRSLQVENMSRYAQAFLGCDDGHAARVLGDGGELDPNEVHWTELNPRFLSAAQLSRVTGFLLPASVTIPACDVGVYGATPLQPVVGPFKVREHVCGPVPGVCGVCGRNRGKGFELREVGGVFCVVEKGREEQELEAIRDVVDTVMEG